ncbi:hypothetical protein DFR33_101400 [Bradymonas sediminis]|nr:hypothetical protein DFR33_101400 [Bradymonas sediminis]
MKMTQYTKIALLAGSLALVGLTGCVEQDVSMSLAGSVVYQGEVNEDTGELRCDMASAKPGSVEMYFQAADLNLSTPMPLSFNAEIINLLEASNQASSGGETFPGLAQDQNSIRVTKATIRYPASLNNFAGAELADQYLAKSAVFSAVLQSGKGGAIAPFELVSLRDFNNAKAFYDAAIAASGLPAGTGDAIIPLIAEIQIEGETFGGEIVESNIFQYPVNLCKDCNPAEFNTTPPCLPNE